MTNSKFFIAASIIAAATTVASPTLAGAKQPSFLNGTGAVEMTNKEANNTRGEGTNSLTRRDIFNSGRLNGLLINIVNELNDPRTAGDGIKYATREKIIQIFIGGDNANKGLAEGLGRERYKRALKRVATHLEEGNYEKALRKIQRITGAGNVPLRPPVMTPRS